MHAHAQSGFDNTFLRLLVLGLSRGDRHGRYREVGAASAKAT